MAGLSGVSTPAVAAAGAGALALWAALRGVGLTGGLRSLLGGKQPVSTHSEDITGSPAGGRAPAAAPPLASNTSTSSVIANDGLSYVGSGSVYKWGGADPVNGWDCSGFVNYVVGHDLRSPIPGSRSGKYSGHGPATMQWALFGQGVSRKDVQAGDLVVWPAFHMGIAISNTQMVNCPGPNGSPAPIVSPIDENIGGPRTFRRIGLTYGGPH